MNITRVNYSRLSNLGNYRNERIELSATFDDSEELETVVNDLRDKVIALLDPTEQQLHDEIYGMKRQLEDLRKKHSDAWQKYQQVKEFMSVQGLKNMPDFPASLPLLTGQNFESEHFEIVDEDDQNF